MYDKYYGKVIGEYYESWNGLVFRDNPTILNMNTCELETTIAYEDGTTDEVYIGKLRTPRESEIIDPTNGRIVGSFDGLGKISYYSDYRATEPDSDFDFEGD